MEWTLVFYHQCGWAQLDVSNSFWIFLGRVIRKLDLVLVAAAEGYRRASLLAICYDACKGLTESVRDMFPHAEWRECFKHRMQNYIKQFSRREHMYLDARAYRKEVHDHHKANVASIEGVLPCLNQLHSLLW
jgi:hypothetical protein